MKNWIKNCRFGSEQHEWYEKATLDEMSKYYTNNNDEKYIVEIGCSDNSYYLNEPLLSNCKGLLIDGSESKLKVYRDVSQFKTICTMINPDNVCNILSNANVPDNFFMLSLDIDGLDFFVMASILKKYKPKHIVTEFNEKIPSGFKYCIKNDSNFSWGWCHNYGYGISCIEDIMLRFGYSIDNVIVNNIYLSKIEDDSDANIEDVSKLYKSGYFDKRIWLYEKFIPWNKDVEHLQLCEKQEDFEFKLSEYFKNNLNVNNNNSMLPELDKYIVGFEYEKYISKFFNEY